MRVTNSSILKYAKYLEYLQYLKYHYFCQRCTCYKLASHNFFILEYFGLSSSTRDIATNQQVPPLTGPYPYPVPVSYSMLLSLLVMNRPQCESFVGFRCFLALVLFQNLLLHITSMACLQSHVSAKYLGVVQRKISIMMRGSSRSASVCLIGWRETVSSVLASRRMGMGF